MEEYIECSFCEKCSSRYIQLLNTYICEKCEKKIVNIDCEDRRYEYYNILLKRTWREYLLTF